MNKEYTKNLTLPWANICKVILFRIKLTGEILLKLVEIIILCRLLHRSVLRECINFATEKCLKEDFFT